jgi:dihydrofolate synthase/folylpolyglutamate synthase
MSTDLVLERLMTLHPKLIDLSLTRVWRLLAALGHPERRLPPVVHVAGTNGKGSVIAYLRAMLEAAGQRVHVYTSPHLVRFHERIRLAGRLIGEDDLLRLLEDCERANGGEPITFFEITTCAAFLAFSRAPADILLLETGLGGRLDATNVVERPLLTVLMPISFDHREHLGTTLSQIAGEKAGIMKRGAPAVIAPQPDEALNVFEVRGRELAVPLRRHGREWTAEQAGGALLFRDEAGERRLPLPGLKGVHQIDNAGAALACLTYLKAFAIDDVAIRRGLAEVEWPARLQRLTRGPLVEPLPPGWELWLDGAHNAAAGEALGETLAAWSKKAASRPVHIIFGTLRTRDPAEILRPLAPHVRDIRTVTIPGEHKTFTAEEAAAAARSAGVPVEAAASVGDALSNIIASEPLPARVLICGSLYLAGTVLTDNG